MTPDFVLENAYFCIESFISNPENGRNRAEYYHVSAPGTRGCVLKYKYTCANKRATDFWSHFMPERLNEMMVVELQRINPADLPFGLRVAISRGITSQINDFDGIFERPSTWAYADDQLPKWREEWKRWLPEARAIAPKE
jgi:hypothetical protein